MRRINVINVRENVNKIIQNLSRMKKGDIGFLYVMSNSVHPKWLKIGMTTRVPNARLHEANYSNMNTWILPAPYTKQKASYKIEYAKMVTYPLHKEKTLHLLLHDKRVNVNKEFFEISLDELMPYFTLVDGEIWKETNDTETTIACRDTRKCFTHGQPIRSTIGQDEWIGIYDFGKNSIVCNGITYTGQCPLTQFVTAHSKKHKKKYINAWKHCECFKKGQWISTNDLEECEDYW